MKPWRTHFLLLCGLNFLPLRSAHGGERFEKARPNISRSASPITAAQADPGSPLLRFSPSRSLTVTNLSFSEIFERVGNRGLVWTDKARALHGRRVNIVGYMVHQEQPSPGVFLLAPFPLQLHESEYGLAEDLPPAIVRVVAPAHRDRIVPFAPGSLSLVGTLEIGNREETDGRISMLRLQMDELCSGSRKRSPKVVRGATQISTMTRGRFFLGAPELAQKHKHKP